MARAICKDKKLSSSKPLFHPPERSRKGRSVDGRVKPGQDGLSAEIRPPNLNQQLSLQAPSIMILGLCQSSHDTPKRARNVAFRAFEKPARRGFEQIDDGAFSDRRLGNRGLLAWSPSCRESKLPRHCRKDCTKEQLSL